MGRIADLRFVSPEAYLDWENQQQEKHEYLRGEVHPMTGAAKAGIEDVIEPALSGFPRSRE